jgi:hypothetical protein
MVDRALNVRGRYAGRPLIWPTLHKSVVFRRLLAAIEEIIAGLIHGRSASIAASGQRAQLRARSADLWRSSGRV